MASPFDYSSYLMSPPVPDLSAMYAAQSRQNARAADQRAGSSAATTSMDVDRGVGSSRGSGSSGSKDGDGKAPAETDESGGPRVTTPFFGIDDPMSYGLDPSTFSSSVNFQMPSFLSGGPFVGDGREPTYFEAPAMPPMPQHLNQPSAAKKFKGPALNLPSPGLPYGRSPYDAQAPRPPQPPSRQSSYPYATGLPNSAPTPRSEASSYAPDTNQPVFAGYGSSFVSVNPDKKPFAPMPSNIYRGAVPARLARETSPGGFDPNAPGLPQAIGGNFPGLYSSSGFDMLGVLARVAARPNPQINIGPVDTSASFLVVDARRYDFPIVFASQTFSTLTGYAAHEIIGRNCRFLQSPTGDVVQGSKRKYTDSSAAFHMKSHILSGKECQASAINYRKDGTPFINLITIIPITWDSDEISYFVGFQVDLVDQPNAILEKMKDGTYVVNYSLLPNAPYSVGPNAVSTPGSALAAIQQGVRTQGPRPPPAESQHDLAARTGVRGDFGALPPRRTAVPAALEAPPPPVEAEAPYGDEEDPTKRAWYKLLLEHTHEFIHVLSLKGSFLYVSPSAARALEYEPNELIGKTIQSICHPSDIVPVMRELKESGNGSAHAIVNLLYRIRRKSSGYVWIEASGKLHLEQGKGRKCVILLGRQRPVYAISWTALGRAGGLGDHEFWAKVALDGMWLYATSKATALIGRDPRDLIGASMLELVPAEQHAQLVSALATAAAGTDTTLRHDMLDAQGQMAAFVTTFHASAPDMAAPAGLQQTPWVVVEINTVGSEDRRRRRASAPARIRTRSSSVASVGGMSANAGSGSDGESGGNASDSSVPSTYSAVASTFKTLTGHPSLATDNMFDELDTTRSTSWQFELHQLQLTNKKLREERDTLQAVRRRRSRRLTVAIPPVSADMGPSASGSSSGSRKVCQNCNSTDSPEWRRGPTGAGTLCNKCGLRYSKSVSRATSMSEASSPAGSPEPSSLLLSPQRGLFSLPSGFGANNFGSGPSAFGGGGG